MFNLGKGPQQLVKVFTEFNTVEDEKLEIDRRYMANDKAMEAWALNQAQQVENRKGEYVQYICENDCEPLELWPEKDKQDKGKIDRNEIDAIQSEAVDEELAFIDKRKKKNRQLVFIGIIACMMFLTLSIIVLILVTRSDSGIQIPGMAMIPLFGFVNKLMALNKVDDKPVPNANIADIKKGEITEYIEGRDIPAGARRKYYRGGQYYFLSRDAQGVLRNIEPRKANKNTISQKELYQVTRCPHIQFVFGMPDTIWDKVSLTALYVLIGASLFVTFIIVGASFG